MEWNYLTALKIWNALPNSIKNMTSLHALLKNLKIYNISEYD